MLVFKCERKKRKNHLVQIEYNSIAVDIAIKKAKNSAAMVWGSGLGWDWYASCWGEDVGGFCRGGQAEGSFIFSSFEKQKLFEKQGVSIGCV